ncbi:MAG: YggT family protein [Actinomyces sp.]|nr:YggT family protein [Actinomyces sp.]
MLVLLTRMVLDWVRFFSPQWRPRGILLAVANLVYALSDPPLRLLRRRIPPLRLGQGFALDVGFMVLFIAVILVQRLGLLLLGA